MNLCSEHDVKKMVEMMHVFLKEVILRYNENELNAFVSKNIEKSHVTFDHCFLCDEFVYFSHFFINFLNRCQLSLESFSKLAPDVIFSYLRNATVMWDCKYVRNICCSCNIILSNLDYPRGMIKELLNSDFDSVSGYLDKLCSFNLIDTVQKETIISMYIRHLTIENPNFP